MSGTTTTKDYIESQKPKFCINCKHVGRNGSGDPLRFKCFAPANIQCTKSDLVTGRSYQVFNHESCYLARLDMGATESCGTDGKWFEPVPPPQFTAPSHKSQIADDLLLKLNKLL